MKTVLRGVGLIALFVLGYRWAIDRTRADDGRSPAIVTPEPAVARTDAAAPTGARAPPPRLPARPEDWNDLGENDFVAALPELQRRAEHGDVAAIAFLFRRTEECVAHADMRDSDIEAVVDETYLLTRQGVAHGGAQPKWPSPEQQRDTKRAELVAIDRRCRALPPGTTAQRIRWLDWAVTRGGREGLANMTGGTFFLVPAERLRYSDQLADIAAQYRTALERWLDTGDYTALRAAGAAYSSGGTLPGDEATAYAYFYACSLLRPDDVDERMLHHVAEGLRPAAVEAARRRGEEIAARVRAKTGGN